MILPAKIKAVPKLVPVFAPCLSLRLVCEGKIFCSGLIMPPMAMQCSVSGSSAPIAPYISGDFHPYLAPTNASAVALKITSDSALKSLCGNASATIWLIIPAVNESPGCFSIAPIAVPIPTCTAPVTFLCRRVICSSLAHGLCMPVFRGKVARRHIFSLPQSQRCNLPKPAPDVPK